MDEPNLELTEWRAVRERIQQLERTNESLRSRERVVFGLYVVLVILGWLVWPGKTLTAQRLSSDRVAANRFFASNAVLSSDDLRVPLVGLLSIDLMLLDHDGSVLVVDNFEHGALLVSAKGAPSIGLWKDSAGQILKPDEPQIELALEGKSPSIVLRDVNGQVIWHAP